MHPFHRSPPFVLILISVLLGIQLWAVGTQFARGFRPFFRTPTRVPFSWDMFANTLERCQLEWSPALDTPAGPFHSLRQLGTRYEWDVAYDRVDHYRGTARWLCAASGKKLQITLHCFYPKGIETHHDFSCG